MTFWTYVIQFIFVFVLLQNKKFKIEHVTATMATRLHFDTLQLWSMLHKQSLIEFIIQNKNSLSLSPLTVAGQEKPVAILKNSQIQKQQCTTC